VPAGSTSFQLIQFWAAASVFAWPSGWVQGNLVHAIGAGVRPAEIRRALLDRCALAGRIDAASWSLVTIQSAVAPGTQVWAWTVKGKPAARRSAYNAVRSARAECLAAAAREEPPQLKLLLLHVAARR